MVCDVLAGLVPESTFDGTVSEVCRRIGEVNHHLLTLSARAASERVATTVVTLLARGRECAVVWAGDSRAYRWRDGTLEKLTTDHSVAAALPEGQAASSVITRALGAAPNLKLDLVRYEARPGDRFLLCSDGLTNAVPETAIATALAGTALDRAVRGLIDSALAAGGPDNVTVLVVEAAA
jgi:serine/threonine protein phosphatase PrpC